MKYIYMMSLIRPPRAMDGASGEAMDGRAAIIRSQKILFAKVDGAVVEMIDRGLDFDFATFAGVAENFRAFE
jgi:hypothetical protein